MIGGFHPITASRSNRIADREKEVPPCEGLWRRVSLLGTTFAPLRRNFPVIEREWIGRDPLKKRSQGQLDKVTAGATNLQIPLNAALFANGSNGPGGVNQFSPATATVTQTNIPTSFNLFTVH